MTLFHDASQVRLTSTQDRRIMRSRLPTCQTIPRGAHARKSSYIIVLRHTAERRESLILHKERLSLYYDIPKPQNQQSYYSYNATAYPSSTFHYDYLQSILWEEHVLTRILDLQLYICEEKSSEKEWGSQREHQPGDGVTTRYYLNTFIIQLL